MKESREQILDRLREELGPAVALGDIQLDSQDVRDSQYEKIHERIETVLRLRAWSLGQSVLHVIH